MTDSLNVKEFIAGYLAEAEELLSSASRHVLAVEEALRNKEINPKAVRELFRSLHTLKGLSAMVGAEPIVDLTHEMETLLRAADKGGGRLPQPAVDQIVRGLQAIQERVLALARGDVPAPAPKALLEGLASLQLEGTSTRTDLELALDPAIVAKLSSAEKAQILQGLNKGLRAVRVDFHPSSERASKGLNITQVREALGRVGDLVKVLPQSIPAQDGKPGKVFFAMLVVTEVQNSVLAEIVGATAESIQEIAQPTTTVEEAFVSGSTPEVEEATQGTQQKRSFIRVDVARLDDALERLSELVVSRVRLQRVVSELTAQGKGSRELTHAVTEYGRQIRHLRSAIMRARMLPVAELLDRVPLLVRGLSKTAKRPVRLVMDLGRAELDKAVADKVFPAIVHLLRNAVDHALESPEERKAKGKPEEGTISIRCTEQSDHHLELVIEDDGRGIDKEKVARRAHRPVPENDGELLKLIVLPGFSTLDKATQTSGRGFGMDIVKRVIVDELGGELAVQTELTKGTRFVLRVPLTVSILDVFTFECGEHRFVVPVGAVDDLVEVDATQVMGTPGRAQRTQRFRLLKYRGATVPLIKLSELLGLGATSSERTKAIVVRRSHQAFAFEVDRMVGQQEVVVRPLTDPLAVVAGVAGSTDLGTGQPTLVLDLVALMDKASNGETGATA
jgi:two-component system chemotaxis sensor kinase CheA